MSHLLPDLASWALRGGAGTPETPNTEATNPITETPNAPELRAQRLARLEAMTTTRTEDPAPAAVVAAESTTTTVGSAPSPAKDTNVEKSKIETAAANVEKVDKEKETSSLPRIKKAKSAEISLQRKKEQLLYKCLHIQLAGASSNSSTGSSHSFPDACVVDTGSTEISPLTIAEIIALRLSTENDTGVIAYFGPAYQRTLEELRAQSPPDTALVALATELQQQIVAYAATCLVEPDVFPAVSRNGPQQLATALLDVSGECLLRGGSASFFTKLMDDLQQQEALPAIVHAILDVFCALLVQTDSVLGTVSSSSATNETTTTTVTPTQIVTTLTAMCALHKGVAAQVAEFPYFLLPPSTTSTTTNATTTPPPFVAAASSNAGTVNPLLQLLSGGAPTHPLRAALGQRWQPRSGLSIEHGTLLGLCLRVGIPKPPQGSNPAFSLPPSQLLRQSQTTIESLTRTQRQQLALHQNECYNLIMALLKVKDSKRHIMTWFTDVLRVNVGASALRPDTSKVSSMNLLLHASLMLLRLCQPFVNAPDKLHLIDPGFCVHAHGGVLDRTGEQAVSRLGGETLDEQVLAGAYQPKNDFIPFCFFFCAHALHLSMVPALRQNENLLRHISHYHHEVLSRDGNVDAMQNDPRFASLIARQRSEDVALFQEDYVDRVLEFNNFTARVLFSFMERDVRILAHMPEEFVSDICDILVSMVTLKPQRLAGHDFRDVFHLLVHLLSPQYATMVRNYNLRAQLGDVLHDIFLPRPSTSRQRDVPSSIALDPLAGGQSFLLSDAYAQETLAPSLLLLYGEVEHTGYFDKMSHRAKIASLIHYLWESSEHRPAFRRITQNQASFIKFANGIMNETNTLIATVMQKLPEIREAQEKMKNAQGEWNRLSEDERSQITSRLEDNERDVKSSLPLCNKTLQMFGYLNTDTDIRNLFLLPELCSRLVTMLLHVLTKLVGSKGLDLKVDNPEQYDFRPKEMLRDLCAIFALFASSHIFQEECAKSGCDPNLLRSAVKTCRRLHLLGGESMEALSSLPDAVVTSQKQVAQDEALLAHAPEEFLDEILSTFMKDPVKLPSGHFVDRATITQHLLNDPMDPFSREPLTMEQVEPAVELQQRMQAWLQEQQAQRANNEDAMDLE